MSYLNAKLAGSQFVRSSDTKTLFNGRDALPVLVIDTPFCDAIIALQGVQVLTFKPRGDKPWLWLSPHAQFETGRAIRGGIPVCLPWFGVNQQNPEKPKHGFVRNHDWQLLDIQETTTAVTLGFSYRYAGDTPELFATPFTAHLDITLGTGLTLALSLQNDSNTAADFSWAFHTYFAVDDIASTQVSGLDGCDYLDNTKGLKSFKKSGNIHFGEEVDQVFNGTHTPQIIHAQHKLQITGEHCPSCIVWNAGEQVAMSLADIREAYRQTICVERGCAFSDNLHLAAGEKFTSSMTISRLGK